ncbi:MAG: hypothetical protein B6226_05400 [Candidatus Cloacimonetes bacterium 4572_65]|nr:MAG: hypothetical protein B6226_05400 [Candidatus Cloacimonetes bacterium 4572_65]
MYKIAIASGKGGTGKTTLSTNLAYYLSQDHDVLLCDLDVEEPDSHIFINGVLVQEKKIYKQVPELIQEKCISCGRCKEVCAFNAVTMLGQQVMFFNELCHSCYACVELCPTDAIKMVPQKLGLITSVKEDNLNFIEARLDIGQEQAVPLIKQTYDYLDAEFNKDIAIIDSPPGSSCPVVETVKNADYVFLVTEPSPFGLNDLKLAVNTVKLLGKEFSIIINKDDGEKNLIRDFCEKENYEIIAAIPEKKSIAKLYSSGNRILKHDVDFLKQIMKVSEKVLKLAKRKK